MEAGRLNAYKAAPDAMRAVQRVEAPVVRVLGPPVSLCSKIQSTGCLGHADDQIMAQLLLFPAALNARSNTGRQGADHQRSNENGDQRTDCLKHD